MTNVRATLPGRACTDGGRRDYGPAAAEAGASARQRVRIRTMNAGVLASHEGTTLQSLLEAFAGGRIARDRRARLSQIFHLLAEDSWRRVYAGELEVRPPGAPTTDRTGGGR